MYKEKVNFVNFSFKKTHNSGRSHENLRIPYRDLILDEARVYYQCGTTVCQAND